jgi:hypothetical protein
MLCNIKKVQKISLRDCMLFSILLRCREKELSPVTESSLFLQTSKQLLGPINESELLSLLKSGSVSLGAWVYDPVKGWEMVAHNSKWLESHPEAFAKPTKPPVEDNAKSLKEFKSEAKKSHVSGGVSISAEPVWFLIREKRKYGPYSSADLVSQYQKKEISSQSFVWRPGFATWKKFSEIPEFSKESMKYLVSDGENLNVFIKRKFQRSPYEVEIIAHDNSKVLEGKSMVIGEGGLFLSTDKVLHAVGARLKLHFREKDIPSFNAIAEVVSVQKGENSGYCLRFIAISDSDRKKIAKLVTESPQKTTTKRAVNK